MRGGVEVWLTRGVSMGPPVEWDTEQQRFMVKLRWWRALPLRYRNRVLHKMAWVAGADIVVVRSPRCRRLATWPRAA